MMVAAAVSTKEGLIDHLWQRKTEKRRHSRIICVCVCIYIYIYIYVYICICIHMCIHTHILEYYSGMKKNDILPVATTG